MRCPHCRSDLKSIVMETRQQDGAIVRRRSCTACSKPYVSEERPAPDLIIRDLRAVKAVRKPAVKYKFNRDLTDAFR